MTKQAFIDLLVKEGYDPMANAIASLLKKVFEDNDELPLEQLLMKLVWDALEAH